MVVAGETLGIIAGEGELPLAIAESARGDGRTIFVLGLSGMAKPENLRGIPHEMIGIGELGKAIKLLKDRHCTDLTMAGRVVRPQFSDLKLDARGAMALPRIIAAARKGDDALLRLLLGIFETEGFKVIGTAEAARELLAPEGPFGIFEPSPEELEDISKARAVVRAMGALDIGQAAVVADGLVLAVEAAEGTDELLKRVAEAGLAGIAVQAGAALIVDRRLVSERADALGLYLFGFRGED